MVISTFMEKEELIKTINRLLIEEFEIEEGVISPLPILRMTLDLKAWILLILQLLLRKNSE